MDSLSTLRGVTAMLGAMTLLPLVDALSKLLTGAYSPEQITWFRNLIHLLIIFPLVVHFHGWRWCKLEQPLDQLMRGVAFTLMTLTYIMALRWMPLADALTTVFLFPFLVTAVSPLLLGERIGWVKWLAVCTGFFGVFLVIKPSGGELDQGAVFALFAAFFTAAYMILTRKQAGQSPTLVMLLLPALIATLLLGGFMPWYWISPGAADTGIMILIGVVAATVHFLIVVAYRCAEASVIVPLSYFQILAASVLGYFFFGDFPDLRDWIGISVIVFSGLLIIFKKEKSPAPTK